MNKCILALFNLIFVFGACLSLSAMEEREKGGDRKRSYQEAFKDKGKEKVRDTESNKEGKKEEAQKSIEPLVVLYMDNKPAYTLSQKIAHESPFLDDIINRQEGLDAEGHIHVDLSGYGLPADLTTFRYLEDIVTLLYQAKNNESLNQEYLQSIKNIKPGNRLFEEFLDFFGIKDALKNLLIKIEFPDRLLSIAEFEQGGQSIEITQQETSKPLYFRGHNTREVSLPAEIMQLLPYFKNLSTSGFVEGQTNSITTALAEADFELLITVLSFKEVGNYVKAIHNFKNSSDFSELLLKKMENDLITVLQPLIASLYNGNKHTIFDIIVQARMWELSFLEKAFLRFIIETQDVESLKSILEDVPVEIIEDFCLPNVLTGQNFLGFLGFLLESFHYALAQESKLLQLQMSNQKNANKLEKTLTLAAMAPFFKVCAKVITANPAFIHLLNQDDYNSLNIMVFRFETLIKQFSFANKEFVSSYEFFVQACCSAYLFKTWFNIGDAEFKGHIGGTKILIRRLNPITQQSYSAIYDFIAQQETFLRSPFNNLLFGHQFRITNNLIYDISGNTFRIYDAHTGAFFQEYGLHASAHLLDVINSKIAFTSSRSFDDVRVLSLFDQNQTSYRVKKVSKALFLNPTTLICFSPQSTEKEVGFISKVTLNDGQIVKIAKVPANTSITHLKRLNDYSCVLMGYYQDGRRFFFLCDISNKENPVTELRVFSEGYSQRPTPFPILNGEKIVIHYQNPEKIELFDCATKTVVINIPAVGKFQTAKSGWLFFFDDIHRNLWCYFEPMAATVPEIRDYMQIFGIRFVKF